MPCYDYNQGRLDYYGLIYPGEVALPSDNIILQRTPIIGWHNQDWNQFWSACKTLASQIAAPKYVFIDATWDPFVLTNSEIEQHIATLQSIFGKSKICILSSRAQHFYDDLPGCVYFPLFLILNYPDIQTQPKRGRIGCLNRRNAPHRVWLMHHLLEQKLLDPEMDCYSVAFTNIYSNHYCDIDTLLEIKWFNQAQQQWPTQIQTHPDNFPNDYGISHPAWHTGIVIITETEVDQNTLLCEKTAKGILSRSCFSIYMHEVGYRVLEDLGFAPRFFPRHAQDFDIDPILDICRQFVTEQDAIDYSHNHQGQIDHNFAWFAHGQGEVATRPWFNRWHPKLTQALQRL